MNLITNASEAIGDRDGVIRVTTERVTVDWDSPIAAPECLSEGDYVQLEVSDTGRGMTAETQAAQDGCPDRADVRRPPDPGRGLEETSCAVGVKFTPNQKGTITGTLVFSDNAANSPKVVSLSGSGLGGGR
jgi:hypothetical protein